MASTLFADGQYHDYMGVYAGGSKIPMTHDVLEKRGHLLDFAKKIPIETNGTQWPRLTHILLDRIHKKPSDIDHFFLTQINIQSIFEALDNLGLPHSKSHNVMIATVTRARPAFRWRSTTRSNNINSKKVILSLCLDPVADSRWPLWLWNGDMTLELDWLKRWAIVLARRRCLAERGDGRRIHVS